MAERMAVTSKLKLVLAYQDDLGEMHSKSVLMRNLAEDADAEKIVMAVDALGTLYDDSITNIREVVENEILG